MNRKKAHAVQAVQDVLRDFGVSKIRVTVGNTEPHQERPYWERETAQALIQLEKMGLKSEAYYKVACLLRCALSQAIGVDEELPYLNGVQKALAKLKEVGK